MPLGIAMSRAVKGHPSGELPRRGDRPSYLMLVVHRCRCRLRYALAMLAPLWSDLTSWLAINAPGTLQYVHPPGDPARLESAEEQLGFALNAELVEWWHLHDGSITCLVPGYELSSFDNMLGRHKIEREVNLEEEVNATARRNRGLADNEGGRPAWYFPTNYIPIGDNGGGDCLVVDCRPGPEYGYLRDHDHEARGVVPPAYYTSLADLLTRMVTALRTGRPMKVGLPGHTHLATPVIEEGFLSWE
jgi:cell wall assembly regulator SMI1